MSGWRDAGDPPSGGGGALPLPARLPGLPDAGNERSCAEDGHRGRPALTLRVLDGGPDGHRIGGMERVPGRPFVRQLHLKFRGYIVTMGLIVEVWRPSVADADKDPQCGRIITQKDLPTGPQCSGGPLRSGESYRCITIAKAERLTEETPAGRWIRPRTGEHTPALCAPWLLRPWAIRFISLPNRPGMKTNFGLQ